MRRLITNEDNGHELAAALAVLSTVSSGLVVRGSGD